MQALSVKLGYQKVGVQTNKCLFDLLNNCLALKSCILDYTGAKNSFETEESTEVF